MHMWYKVRSVSTIPYFFHYVHYKFRSSWRRTHFSQDNIMISWSESLIHPSSVSMDSEEIKSFLLLWRKHILPLPVLWHAWASLHSNANQPERKTHLYYNFSLIRFTIHSDWQIWTLPMLAWVAQFLIFPFCPFTL